MNNIMKRTSCRLCDSPDLSVELILPMSPIADKYASSPHSAFDAIPQDLYICNSCGHYQILNIAPKELLFDSEYSYSPSKSKDISTHFRTYADEVLTHVREPSELKALDIGSNDGAFLAALKGKGIRTLVGVEPVSHYLLSYTNNGLIGCNAFWDYNTMNALRADFQSFDIISANNVFAHNDDLLGFTCLIGEVLSDSGVFAAEFSYFLDIYEKTLIGTFFHEHLSHHTLSALIPFLERCGLFPFDCFEAATQGGALVLFSAKVRREPTARFQGILEKERDRGLSTHETRRNLRISLVNLRERILRELSFNTGRRIVAFGASRSLNLIIDFLGIRSRIDVVVDSNDFKIGRFLFGGRAQIVSEQDFCPEDGDVVLCTAWVHTESIRRKLSALYVGLDFKFVSVMQ